MSMPTRSDSQTLFAAGSPFSLYPLHDYLCPMENRKILWSLAVTGIRVANAITFVLLVAFIGRLFGEVRPHPILSAWFVPPVVGVLVFESLWVTGRLHRVRRVRSIAAICVVALSALAWATINQTGGTVTVIAVAFLAFLFLMAAVALFRPGLDPFDRRKLYLVR